MGGSRGWWAEQSGGELLLGRMGAGSDGFRTNGMVCGADIHQAISPVVPVGTHSETFDNPFSISSLGQCIFFLPT